MQFKRYHHRKLAQNLTPLIDVMFFLLIFFMLATSFTIYNAMPVQMDKVEVDSAPGNGAVEAIMITVDSNQHIIVNKERMMVNDLRYYLLMQLKSNPDKPIILEAKSQATVQDIVVVIDQIRLSGGRNLMIAEG